MFLGLRTVIYPSPDLAAAKAWYTALLRQEPYFDEPFYVGYNVGGYELGLDPNGDVAVGPIAYWGVANADKRQVMAQLAVSERITPESRAVGEAPFAELERAAAEILSGLYDPKPVGHPVKIDRQLQLFDL